MMTPFLFPLVLLSLFCKVEADVVQDDWIWPQSPDNSTTLILGQTAVFKWTTNLQSWIPEYLPNGNASKLDIWVTGQHESEGFHKLAAGFDLTKETSFSWLAIVPSSELSVEQVWVFRFLAANDDILTGTGNQISSPLFYLNASSSSSSTSMAPAPSTHSATIQTLAPSATSSTALQTTEAPTSPSQQISASTVTSSLSTSTSGEPASSAISTGIGESEKSEGLSVGAKAGIGIGAGVGAVILCGIALFYLTRSMRVRQSPRQFDHASNDGDWSTPVMEIQSNLSYQPKT